MNIFSSKNYKDIFFGSIVAMITPMNSKGKIDKLSLKRIINYHIKNGTKAIVCAGTTGERTLLNNFEHFDLLLRTLEYADEKIPIIVGNGASSTKEAIQLNNFFEKTSVFACLTSPPSYIKLSQKCLYEHFKCISENTNLPQILYNIPTRTGSDLLPRTISKLADLNNIVAIKESTGDLSRVKLIKRLVNKNFILLCGNDSIALDFMQLGGHGLISVIANIAANLVSNMCKFYFSKQYSKAEKLNSIIYKLNLSLSIDSNPIPIKWMAFRLKLINSAYTRLPFLPLTNFKKNKLKKVLKKVQLMEKFSL